MCRKQRLLTGRVVPEILNNLNKLLFNISELLHHGILKHPIDCLFYNTLWSRGY